MVGVIVGSCRSGLWLAFLIGRWELYDWASWSGAHNLVHWIVEKLSWNFSWSGTSQSDTLDLEKFTWSGTSQSDTFDLEKFISWNFSWSGTSQSGALRPSILGREFVVSPELFFQEYWQCSWSWCSGMQTSGVKSLVFGNWNYQNTLLVLTLTFPNIYWAVISASKHAVVNTAVTVCIFR